jgi:hypothetical protein
MLRLARPWLSAVLPLVLPGVAIAQLQWTPLGGLPRSVGYPVFDAARGRVVVFGTDFGTNGSVANDHYRAYEWNGAWQAHELATDSGLATITGAVFDHTRNVTVLVGNPAFIGPPGQPFTVSYRGGRFGVPIQGVPVRPYAGFVDDAARGGILAFGGSGTASFTVVDTMWRWNGSLWSVVNQPSLRPSPRQNPALVFDPLRQRVVLFGGSDGVSNPLSDTWTWDGQVWQQMATSGPAPRERAGFAFDPQSGACLLHGGYVRGSEVSGTWLWNGAGWTQVAVTNSPGAGLLVESTSRPLLLREQRPSQNGTFRWNGAGFDLLAPPQNALTRGESELVYDAARNELVLFGGQPVAGGLWLWNGAWRHVGLAANGPVARRNHSMVYDAQRQQVVLFGGRDADVGGLSLGDTWTWDGTTWTQHVTAQAPSPRFGSGFTYDTARGQCVLFGGVNVSEFGDTWIWNGAAWTQAQPAVSPSPRWNPGMACDEVRQRVVLVNGMIGGSSIAETWEWDGATWLQRNPVAHPGGAVAYDRRLGRVVLVTSYGAIHGWDGAEWQPVPVFAPPTAQPNPMSMTWHDSLDRLVLYSTGVGAETLWALTSTAPQPQIFAAACPAGSTNDCDLLALGLPRLGNSDFELDLRSGAANVPGAVLWGSKPGRFPTAGGCVLLVDDPITSRLVYTNASGYGRVRLQVPDLDALLGVSLYVQGFVLDGQGPIGGASASAGLRLQLGR